MPGVYGGMGSSIMGFPSELLLDDDRIGGGDGGGGIVVFDSSGIRNGGSEVASPSFSVGNASCSTAPRPEREREPARSVKDEVRKTRKRKCTWIFD